MINGLAFQTTGQRGAVDYLIADRYEDKETKIWYERDPVPVVLEGDHKAFIQACDGIKFKNKYTSGVLSFSPAETKMINATPGLKDEIFEDFKKFAFAGIPEDCRNILAVQHTHTRRLEIHYLIPRVHLETGKSWNPFEPNYEKNKKGKGGNYKFIEQNDAYIDNACIKFGLQNPRDLSVARDIKISQFDKNSATKKEVHNFVSELIIGGHINCREDIEDYFKQAGGTITRSADEYISVKFDGAEKGLRFRGGIYDKGQFGASALSTRDLYEKAKPTAESIGREFDRVMDERVSRVQERHGQTEKDFDQDQVHGQGIDREGQELESEFSEYTNGIGEIDKAGEDLPDIKSSVADFVGNNRGAIENYREVAASVGTGVEAGDVAVAQTDDPVIRFFQSQFKQQARAEEQRAIADSKKRWSNSPSSPVADELLAKRVGVLFSAFFGMQTGIDIDRQGAAFDCKALAESAAKASDLAQQRAVMIEHDRQQLLQAAVAEKLAASIHEREDADERARKEREERRVPSWKRNGHDLDDDSGPRPGGR
ncbi:MAG: hypothetical protein ACOH2P_19045 [Pseudomonas sp.]